MLHANSKKTFQLFVLNCKVNVFEPHTCEAMRWDIFSALLSGTCWKGGRSKSLCLVWWDFLFYFTFCFSQMGLKFCLALNHGAQALEAWRMTRCHLPFITVEVYFLQMCIGDVHPAAEESALKPSSHNRAWFNCVAWFNSPGRAALTSLDFWRDPSQIQSQ